MTLRDSAFKSAQQHEPQSAGTLDLAARHISIVKPEAAEIFSDLVTSSMSKDELPTHTDAYCNRFTAAVEIAKARLCYDRLVHEDSSFAKKHNALFAAREALERYENRTQPGPARIDKMFYEAGQEVGQTIDDLALSLGVKGDLSSLKREIISNIRKGLGVPESKKLRESYEASINEWRESLADKLVYAGGLTQIGQHLSSHLVALMRSKAPANEEELCAKADITLSPGHRPFPSQKNAAWQKIIREEIPKLQREAVSGILQHMILGSANYDNKFLVNAPVGSVITIGRSPNVNLTFDRQGRRDISRIQLALSKRSDKSWDAWDVGSTHSTGIDADRHRVALGNRLQTLRPGSKIYLAGIEDAAICLP